MAFPSYYSHYFEQGMELRAYFASAAMQGMWAGDDATSIISTPNKAQQAYEMADAMLEARKE